MNRTKREYENINLMSDCTLIASANERGMRYLHNVKPKLHEQYNQYLKCAELIVLTLLQWEDMGIVLFCSAYFLLLVRQTNFNGKWC